MRDLRLVADPGQVAKTFESLRGRESDEDEMSEALSLLQAPLLEVPGQ